MKPQFHVTYDIVSHESAIAGDYESAGFVMPGNWHHELPADCCGPAAAAFKADCAMTLREALNLVSGIYDSGSDGRSYYEADSRIDYATGNEERRALHVPDNVSEASRARIARVLGVKIARTPYRRVMVTS